MVRVAPSPPRFWIVNESPEVPEIGRFVTPPLKARLVVQTAATELGEAAAFAGDAVSTPESRIRPETSTVDMRRIRQLL